MLRVDDILCNRAPSFSFEFFPPKTEEGWDKLYQTVSNLRPLHPAYVSITCGALGQTRAHTHCLVERIVRETNLTVTVHQTCAGQSRDAIRRMIDQYVDLGVRNVLALCGDPPRDTTDTVPESDRYPHAADLVADIKHRYPAICVGVAGFPEGHPATPNRLLELEYLKRKVDAGADYMVTQLFFDNHDFYAFRARCRLTGIRIPIIPGIMPVTSRRGMYRMADIAQGACIPASLIRSVERAPNLEYIKNVGIHWATEQVRDLLDHQVPGIHFYTLNNSDATLRICETLGVEHALQLEPDNEPVALPSVA